MKIALRNKPTKTQGRSLYLDFYDNGRRWYEFLNLFLTGDRQRDKETMRLAKGIISQIRLRTAVINKEVNDNSSFACSSPFSITHQKASYRLKTSLSFDNATGILKSSSYLPAFSV